MKNRTIRIIEASDSVIVMIEDEAGVHLIEIDNVTLYVRKVSIGEVIDPLFTENDAWLIARAILDMKEGWADNFWTGKSDLLRVAFSLSDVENGRLAALVYCRHFPEVTNVKGEAGKYRFKFDGHFWEVSVRDERLQYVTRQ